MKTKKIAFDLDGVLLNFVNAFELQFSDYFQGRVKLIDDGNFKMKTAPWIPDEQIWDIIKLAYSRIEDMPPFPGAREVTSLAYHLMKEPVYIVTRRPVSHAHWTHMAIEQFIKVPYMVSFSKDYDKRQYLDGYDYFVDDRRKTALGLAKWGMDVLIPRRGYNKIENPPNRIHYYDELSDLIEELPILIG